MKPDRTGATKGVADAPYLHLIRDTPYTPIFVLGEHRSGTSILYRLLTLSGSFNYTTLYHTLRYDELLSHHVNGTEETAKNAVTERLKELGIANRIIDDMEVGPEYADEYCFILVTHGSGFALTRRNYALFDESCRKTQYISDHQRPLLLKNPFDFARFLLLQELVPDAKIIFIHRHPIDVFNSMLRAVRTSWFDGNPLNQLRSPAYRWAQQNTVVTSIMRWLTGPGVHLQPAFRMLSHRISKNAAYYRANIDQLDPKRYISLRYEDLCAEPQAQMERLLDFCGVAPRIAVDYRELIRPRALKRLPDVERATAQLTERFAEILTYHGYPRA